MRKVLLAYSQLASIFLYLIALWQSNSQTGMIPDVGHHIPRQWQTVTTWIRLLYVRKRNMRFEEQHKGRQISRLSLNTFLDVTGMVLSCSDSELLFYLRVILSVWIPRTKIAMEYYNCFIRRTLFVGWFNLSDVTYTTRTRTSVSDILWGTEYYEFSIYTVALASYIYYQRNHSVWEHLLQGAPIIPSLRTCSVFPWLSVPAVILWFSAHAMNRGDC